MCFGLARFAAAVKPLDKQADIELCDLTLIYSEQPANEPGRCQEGHAITHYAFTPVLCCPQSLHLSSLLSAV